MDQEAEQVDRWLEAGDPAAFASLVSAVRRTFPPPATTQAWGTLAQDPSRAPQLWQLLKQSNVLACEPYSLEGPPPLDFRSRLLVEDLLHRLGEHRHGPARSTLEHLLVAHPTRLIRLYSAHGLLAWGDREALETVASRTTDPDLVQQALKATFRLGPESAFDRIQLEDPSILPQALSSLMRDFKWDPAAKRNIALEGWLRAEPRWVELAVSLQRDPARDAELRRLARDLLGLADPLLVKRFSARQGGKTPRPAIDRQARSVALKRARAEIKGIREEISTLIANLKQAGYRFVAEPSIPPAKNIRSRLTAFEKRLGLIPASVRAWYELIGAVDLRGTHPDWELPGTVDLPDCYQQAALTDPLVVAGFESVEGDAEDEPDLSEISPDDVIPFVLRLAPEPLTKAGYSAGPGYGVALGAPGVIPPDDPVLADDPNQRTFLQHVRYALERGGFLGSTGGAGE